MVPINVFYALFGMKRAFHLIDDIAKQHQEFREMKIEPKEDDDDA